MFPRSSAEPVAVVVEKLPSVPPAQGLSIPVIGASRYLSSCHCIVTIPLQKYLITKLVFAFQRLTLQQKLYPPQLCAPFLL
jgi:hypothetical protein